MYLGPPKCDACGQEILPGEIVEILGYDGEQRIIVDDDISFVHAECPPLRDE